MCRHLYCPSPRLFNLLHPLHAPPPPPPPAPALRRAAIICGAISALFYEAGEQLLEKLKVGARVCVKHSAYVCDTWVYGTRVIRV